MKSDKIDPIVAEISGARIGDQFVELTYTGGKSQVSAAFAYEFIAQSGGARYILKFFDAKDGLNNETSVLKQVNRLFQTESILESSAVKQMGYMPVPTVVGDSIELFNDEFMRSVDPSEYKILLETAARGQSCERELPPTYSERLKIVVELAKLLRLCARAKIAYVDIKPLEHVFWTTGTSGRTEITLIDWGNARTDATTTQLVDDIRKFCTFLPELIYGKKMLDLTNNGKYEYPIQKENDRRLISLLGQLSFNTNNPPLTQKYAQLVGDLVAGSLNEIRLQTKIVDVWDDILRILFEAQSAFERDTGAIVSWESLRRDAEAAFSVDADVFRSRDFARLCAPRLTSLASYRAWLLPAMRFIQTWYGKIDLIPQRGFDDCSERILANDPTGLQDAFTKVGGVIRAKFNRMTLRSDFSETLLESLTHCADVIQAWEFMKEIEDDKMSSGVFQVTFSTSNLRVIDPLLADAYRKQCKHSVEITAERAIESAPSEPEPVPATEAVIEGEIIPVEPKAAEPPPAFNRRSAQLLDVYRNLKRFSHLANVDFFRDLNDFITENKDYETEIAVRLSPVFDGMLSEVEAWIDGISPDRFIVPDAFLNSVDWLQNLPPAVEGLRVSVQGSELSIFEAFQDKLYTCQIDLARAGNASLELRQNPALRDSVGRIKMLRKKLDSENMIRFRRLLQEHDYVSVQQIIDDHYIEFPEMYERLRNEMAFQERNDEDQRTLAIINTVVNDLYHNSGNLETGKLLKNQGNIPYISQRLSDYRQRNAQMIEMQSELMNTKEFAMRAARSIQEGKRLSALTILIAVVMLIVGIVLLATSMSRNVSQTQMISQLQRQISEYQATNQALAQRQAEATPIVIVATMAPTVAAATPPADVPVVIVGPDVGTETGESAAAEPTADLSSEGVPPVQTPVDAEAEALLSPSDRHLNALLNQQVRFTLPGNLALFGDAELTPKLQVGTVTDFAQDVGGKLVAYNEKAVQLEIPFNIFKDRVSASTQQNVLNATNIRRYSDTPGNTPLVFITMVDVVLTEPIKDCTEEATSFCHGTFSLWIERSGIENSIK